MIPPQLRSRVKAGFAHCSKAIIIISDDKPQISSFLIDLTDPIEKVNFEMERM